MPLFQDVDARLTLTQAATAPRLVAEVARLAHQHLEVSPSLATEVLMVSVENAKVADVLARIAVAATATWQPVEGGYRLVADANARSIEASAERARRLQALSEALRKRQEEMAKAAKEGAKGSEAANGMAEAFMGGTGTDAFVPLLDPSVLSAMESGDRVVFATSPNASQRPLRGNPNAIVKAWIDEHNKTAKAMAGSMGEMPEGLDALMKGPLGDRMRRMSRPVVGAPAKVVVVASRGASPFFGGTGLDVRLEVRAYAADGSVLLEETGALDSGMMAFVAAMQGNKATAPAPKSTVIVYSEDAKALMGFSRVGGAGMSMGADFSRGLKMPPSLHERLFAPDRFEPLALVPGEGLVALAKARRRPLVACLPDSAYPGILMSDVPKTVEEVEAGLSTGPMRVVPDASFLVVKPSEPQTTRHTQLDRTALATLMRAIADHEVPTLDELAAFAAATPPPGRNAVSMSFLGTFAPSAMGSMSGVVSWDALRLYASLAPAQRQTLASGGRVSFHDVGPLGQAALAAMLYGATGTLEVERAGAPAADDILSRGIKIAIGGGGVDARDEPTEVAPRGLPTGGYLQATVATDTILRPLTADGPSNATLGTDELAMLRMITTGPMAEQVAGQIKMPESARLGSRTTWNLRGYVAPGAYVGGTLTDDRTPKDGQKVSLASLPADLQAKVAAKTDKLKSSPLGAMIAMGAAMGRPQAKP